MPKYQSPTANPPSSHPYPYPLFNSHIDLAFYRDFLETLDDASFFAAPSTVAPSLMSTSSTNGFGGLTSYANFNSTPTPVIQPSSSSTSPAQQSLSQTQSTSALQPTSTETSADSNSSSELPAPPLPSESLTKTEKFLLTAADQEDGSRDERLNRVIRSKYEAGLLKPYNYVKGYARLSRWMDRNVSQESKQQILQPLSVLRPKFRAVAQSLRDMDLVLIEEAFERLLLDYDRVFSAMGVPACLWRRTGEIYKANREFCELVGVQGALMREGRLCIYELMAEESAVNYWEKYGHVAFDSSQKAVLTSCVLRYKPQVAHLVQPPPPTPRSAGGSSPPKAAVEGNGITIATGTAVSPTPAEEGLVNCCFSFTIRRDKWGIPTMIVGNFIKC
ncbi:Transcription factor [Marasmius crinis-equi]|uniref:Transcription factor n=1 Tax=Marasmius crinis-equi TaxID=585013 RepID=A0ABR3FHF2_9AGAR